MNELYIKGLVIKFDYTVEDEEGDLLIYLRDRYIGFLKKGTEIVRHKNVKHVFTTKRDGVEHWN